MANERPVFSFPAMNFLRADLGYFDSEIPGALESYLVDLLDVAKNRLASDCGIVLDDSNIADNQLQASFAAWLYRSRTTGSGKPEMLKCDIRNRQVNGPASGQGGSQ